MTIQFGTYEFVAESRPRENGSVLFLSFFPKDLSFEEMKRIMNDSSNTSTITVTEGTKTTYYRDFSVLKTLVYADNSGDVVATVELWKTDLQEEVHKLKDASESQSESIDYLNTSIDDIMTVVIPTILGDMTE